MGILRFRVNTASDAVSSFTKTKLDLVGQTTSPELQRAELGIPRLRAGSRLL